MFHLPISNLPIYHGLLQRQISNAYIAFQLFHDQ